MEEGSSNKRARSPAKEDDKGTHLVVLIDESTSMEPQERTMLPAVCEALRALCRTVVAPNELSVKLFCFNDELRLVCDNTLGALVEMGIPPGVHYAPRGTTALYDAIIGGLEHCARGATLLVATDGGNNCGRYTRESARKALRSARDGRGIKVLWLAEGSDAAKEAHMLDIAVTKQAGDVPLSLSQAMQDPVMHEQLSQSLAIE